MLKPSEASEKKPTTSETRRAKANGNGGERGLICRRGSRTNKKEEKNTKPATSLQALQAKFVNKVRELWELQNFRLNA